MWRALIRQVADAQGWCTAHEKLSGDGLEIGESQLIAFQSWRLNVGEPSAERRPRYAITSGGGDGMR